MKHNNKHIECKRELGDETSPEVEKLAEEKERPEVERGRPMKVGDGEEREELKDLERMRQ